MQQAIAKSKAPSQVSTATADEKFHTADVLTVSAGHGIHDTYSAFLAPLLPEFIRIMSLSTTQAGTLSLFMQFPSLLQPVVGYLADRRNLRWLFILAPAVTAIAMSIMGFAPTYFVLALLLLVAGVGSAGLHAIGPVVVGLRSGANLGRGMSFWMVGGEFGRTVGPLIIVTAVGALGLRNIYWLMIFGILTSAIIYWRLRDIPQPVKTAAEVAASRPWQETLREASGFLLPLVALLTTRGFLNVAMATYLPIYMTTQGASLATAGLALTVLEGAGVIGAMLGGSLSDRLGRRPVLLTTTIVTPLFMFLFLMVDGLLRFPVLLLMGFVGLAMTPVMMALVQETFPEDRALANGTYMGIGFVTRSVIVIVLGMLADTLGIQAAFAISAGLTLLGVPFVLWLTKATPAQAAA